MEVVGRSSNITNKVISFLFLCLLQSPTEFARHLMFQEPGEESSLRQNLASISLDQKDIEQGYVILPTPIEPIARWFCLRW